MTEEKQVLHCLESVPWGGNGGKVLAHSLDDSTTPHPESSADAHTPVQQQPNGCGIIWINTAGLVNQPQGYQWSNGITEEERIKVFQKWTKIMTFIIWNVNNMPERQKASSVSHQAAEKLFSGIRLTACPLSDC